MRRRGVAVFVLTATCALSCWGPSGGGTVSGRPSGGGASTGGGPVSGGGGPIASGERLPVPGWPELKTGRFPGVLHGSGPLWTEGEHEAYRAALPDRAPVVIRHGINLHAGRHGYPERLALIEADFDRFADELPMLTVEFVRSVDGQNEGLDPGVANGEYDRRLFPLADMLARLERPCFLRVGAEVNGDWSGYTPRSYLEAYRRIHRIVSQRAPQVIFMWNCKLTLTPLRPWQDFYPGDDLVDWWSIDLFSDDLRVPALRRDVDAFLAEARRRGKPVFIPECGPTQMDMNAAATWSGWFAPFFALLVGDDNIKGFTYSNRDFATKHQGLSHWGDMRIDRSALLPRYRQALDHPAFIHGPAPYEPRGGPAPARPSGSRSGSR